MSAINTPDVHRYAPHIFFEREIKASAEAIDAIEQLAVKA